MNNKKILGNIAQAIDNPLNYKFDKIKNKNTKLSYNIRITVPEFTSICPVTSQPDFALIVIDYIPKLNLVESKSFKVFIQSFRNYGIFHEEATLLIGSSLFNSLKPSWIRIAGYFAPRGGIPIDVFWQSGKTPKDTFVPELTHTELKINR